MQRIIVGYRVVDIRGRIVGRVTALNGDCFQVKRITPDSTWNLTQAAIFNVAIGEVSLVCDAAECDRYSCEVHIG